jgi:hypothetical protein
VTSSKSDPIRVAEWPEISKRIERMMGYQEKDDFEALMLSCRFLSEHILATRLKEAHPKLVPKKKPTLKTWLQLCESNHVISQTERIEIDTINSYAGLLLHYNRTETPEKQDVAELSMKYALRLASVFLPDHFYQEFGSPDSIQSREKSDPSDEATVECWSCLDSLLDHDPEGDYYCNDCDLWTGPNCQPNCPVCDRNWMQGIRGPLSEEYYCDNCDHWFQEDGELSYDYGDYFTELEEEAAELDEEAAEQLEEAAELENLVNLLSSESAKSIIEKGDLISRCKKFRNSVNGVVKRGFYHTDRDSIRKSALKSHCEENNLDWTQEFSRRTADTDEGIDEWDVWADVDELVEISVMSEPSDSDWYLVHSYLGDPSIVGTQGRNENYAILVRCNPGIWDWKSHIPEDGATKINWTTRFRLDSIIPGTRVVVLGTGGSGVLASGKALGSVINRSDEQDDADSGWVEGNESRVNSERVLPLSLSRFTVDSDIIRQSEVGYLIRRQSTMTWLTKKEYEQLIELGC